MQATLMNVGDNVRVVNDKSNIAVTIGIGQIVETNIHDVHFHMIRRAVTTETLLIVPRGVKQSARLRTIMRLLRDVESESYDELLTEYATVIEQGEVLNLRPTRTEMRLQLRDAARHEVDTALRAQKVNIREQGDEVTRQPAAPQKVVVPPAETQQPKRVESPDRRDKAARKAQRAGAKS